MKTKSAVMGMILVGIVGCAHMGGLEEKEKIYGKNPPVIEKSFASNQLRPGDQWKIYVLASDPDGDMDALIAVVNQPGMGSYPISLTKIKEENGKELSGYFYLNTSGPFGSDFLFNQELAVSIQMKDKAGHTSQPVSLSVLLLSTHTQKSAPAGVFKEKELGPIMVTLRPASGRTI
jgi:hypothetical protein